MDSTVRSMTHRRRAAEHASRFLAETSNLFPGASMPSDLDGLWKGKNCWLGFELKYGETPIQGGQWWMLRDLLKALAQNKPAFLVGVWYTAQKDPESILTSVSHFVVFWSTSDYKCVRRTHRRPGGHLTATVGMLVEKSAGESISTLGEWELVEWSDRWRVGGS